MIKSKKSPTAQELYRARKQREEEEKEAYLPPGLINHGNTCFMNSVLQGLIATPLLYKLVHFQPVPASIEHATSTPPISSQRSPQLTNGHGLAGPYEKEWVQGMSLGDVFMKFMGKAWDNQNNKRRESMSPKELLAAIGRKYDQYASFGQQDAHEFMSHLLDAIRMEELDVIKQRQPPPPRKKRRRGEKPLPRSPRQQFKSSLPTVEEKNLSAEASSSSNPPGTDSAVSPTANEMLATFSDMLFGGKLASILVCEKCKHVSCTYEDFNDLSLSIKPEDYVRERKRDKLKMLAKKLRLTPGIGAGSASGSGLRSSSVPASPIRRSSEVAADHEPPVEVHTRRRSVDATQEVDDGSSSGLKNEVTTESSQTEVRISQEWEEVNGAEKASGDTKDGDVDHVGFAEQQKPDRGRKDKEKDDDGWTKLGKRISMSMGLGKKERGRKGRSLESPRESLDPEQDKPKVNNGEEGSSSAPIPIPPSSLSDPSLKHLTRSASPAISIKEGLRNRDLTPSRAASPSPVPSGSPLVPPPTRRPIIKRAGTPSIASKRSHRPPKLSREESAYLRSLLADVHLPSSSPLAMFRPPSSSHVNHPVPGPTAQNLWAKLGHISSVEECLRLFTAVEVLDGENMVGCRRCWKIANGTLHRHSEKTGKGAERAGIDSDDTDESEEEEEEQANGTAQGEASQSAPALSPSTSPAIRPVSPSQSLPDADPSETSLPRSPSDSPHRASTVQSPASSAASLSTQSSLLPADADDATSISSIAATMASALTSVYRSRVAPHRSPKVAPPSSSLDLTENEVIDISTPSASPEPPVTAYGGQPIPSISTTAPESPMSPVKVPGVSNVQTPLGEGSKSSSLSRTSLQAPRVHYGQLKDDGSDTDDESPSESSDTETDGSESVYGYSDASPALSPYASPTISQEHIDSHSHRDPVGLGLAMNGALRKTTLKPDCPSSSEKNKKKIPRSKQVILRRAYKRYLVATAPPVLVIHLKRFQQISKNPMISFSSGFKKIDDYVSFPEFLDLGPFLTPKKEKFGLGGDAPPKNGDSGVRSKEVERCMYRLYAVVVHIGNMLGGHYVAYAALPNTRQPPDLERLSDDPMAANGPSQNEQTQASSAEYSDRNSPQQWAYISDQIVRLTTLEEVLKAKAYLCMYERI